MLFTTAAFTQLLLTFAPVTLAQLQNDLVASLQPRAITPPNRYRLRTSVTHGGDPSKHGLYVSGYHTGAGLNDAVLTEGTGSIGFLNDTYQQFDFNTTFPWSFNLISASNYGAWEDVQLNVGQDTPGFFFNETGLQWSANAAFDPNNTSPATDEFGGWLACDWYHGVPQLFWKFSYADPPIPCSCATVQLYPEAVVAAISNPVRSAPSADWFRAKHTEKPEETTKATPTVRGASEAPEYTSTERSFQADWFKVKRAKSSIHTPKPTTTKASFKADWFKERRAKSTSQPPKSTPTKPSFKADWFKQKRFQKRAQQPDIEIKPLVAKPSKVPSSEPTKKPSTFGTDWFKLKRAVEAKETTKATPTPKPTKVAPTTNWFIKRAVEGEGTTTATSKPKPTTNWFIKRAEDLLH
ncbi:uncharacterized protein KY384_000124 [Bacidia gigantensis]|uniref:uncharacterized protein n=1 Tax=Bacidia gigantensis TaxID=2732470 RepID=UPI001D0477BD|nr:uncharacterized protein KY384_000124 [Bacidia gigantensis]KAG8526131.1 hypothetical protein KY384_000124 [Bacidia gigantensis]